MVFSSYSFIFVFLPITVLGYHLLRQTRRTEWIKVWLVAMSLIFYGMGQLDFLPWFIATIVLNYGIIRQIKRSSGLTAKRLWLLAAVIWNIGLLFYYKYCNFTLHNINWLFRLNIPLLEVALPIGISFFTFQILAFTVSFYRDECDFPNLLDYAVFVTFFPQLIVGPVVKHEELMPAVTGDRLLSFEVAWIPKGIMLFSVGCAKKILLADTMTRYASAFYGGNVVEFSFLETWIAVFSYVFAYYFDFSGYIDMARGLGCFFGIELPVNFDSPYKAKDFSDFWRRWNMTISRFFNETIFSNIFGFGDGIFKLILATMATFLVSGLWHGAAWHYIFWGLANGVLVCISNIRALLDRKPLPGWLAVFITFMGGVLTRVLFDCTGMTQAVQIYKTMFDFRNLLHVRTMLNAVLVFIQNNPMLTLILIVSAVICFCLPNSNRIMEQEHPGWKEAAASAVLLALSLFNMTQVSTFLYFNF